MFHFFVATAECLVVKGKLKGPKDSTLVFITDVNNPQIRWRKLLQKESLMRGDLKEPALRILDLKVEANNDFPGSNSTVKITGKAGQTDKFRLPVLHPIKIFAEFQSIFDPIFCAGLMANQQLQ